MESCCNLPTLLLTVCSYTSGWVTVTGTDLSIRLAGLFLQKRFSRQTSIFTLPCLILYYTSLGGEQAACWRAGLQFRGSAAGWRSRMMGTSWSSAKPSVKSCIWGGITSCSSAGRGTELNRKPLSRKGLGDMVDSKVNTSSKWPCGQRHDHSRAIVSFLGFISKAKTRCYCCFWSLQREDSLQDWSWRYMKQDECHWTQIG